MEFQRSASLRFPLPQELEENDRRSKTLSILSCRSCCGRESKVPCSFAKSPEHPKLLEEFLRETLPLEKFCNAALENFESHCQTLGGSRHLSKCFNSASMLLQLPDMFHHVPFHLNQSSQSCRCHHVPYDTCLVHILHLKTATGCCGFQSTQSNQSTLHRPVGESHGR